MMLLLFRETARCHLTEKHKGLYQSIVSIFWQDIRDSKAMVEGDMGAEL